MYDRAQIEVYQGFNNKQLKANAKKVRLQLNSNIQHIVLLCSKDGQFTGGGCV